MNIKKYFLYSLLFTIAHFNLMYTSAGSGAVAKQSSNSAILKNYILQKIDKILHDNVSYPTIMEKINSLLSPEKLTELAQDLNTTPLSAKDIQVLQILSNARLNAHLIQRAQFDANNDPFDQDIELDWQNFCQKYQIPNHSNFNALKSVYKKARLQKYRIIPSTNVATRTNHNDDDDDDNHTVLPAITAKNSSVSYSVTQQSPQSILRSNSTVDALEMSTSSNNTNLTFNVTSTNSSFSATDATNLNHSQGQSSNASTSQSNSRRSSKHVHFEPNADVIVIRPRSQATDVKKLPPIRRRQTHNTTQLPAIRQSRTVAE